ncbi:MAG: gliding motility-associated C-terminal domain-containing protein [Vicingus serpentipes]|nr:gliding motility-associated C-terminal domain-containing protein [Vicingus serpentipes]
MKTFFTYILLFLTLTSIGQTNLVTNGSFEDIDSCYGDPSPLGFDVFQWSGCSGWINPTYASSDLWCENPVFGNNTPPFIPGVGFQVPRTGDNISGILVFELAAQNYREYIQNELAIPLTKDKYYQFTMYLSVAGYDAMDGQATSCVQVYFSDTQPLQPSSYQPLNVTPQITNPSNNFYTDTLDWILFTGVYQANGNEKYITIGCFEDSATIALSKQPTDSTGGDNYFFIDDIELTELPISYHFSNVFSPNGDNTNDLFSPNVENIEDWECIIYNRWGQEIYKLNNGVSSWDGRTTTGKNVPEGTYYYVFSATIENENISEKGFIELLR